MEGLEDFTCGRWSEDENIKLKGAIKTLDATLIPGRTSSQCCSRWHDALDPSIDRANGRTGARTEDEDIKLKGAVRYKLTERRIG
jgi:hypothetical protein